RTWLDTLGTAIQRLSAAADRVDYVVAGRALSLVSERVTGAYGRYPAQTSALRRHGDRDVRPGEADHAVNVLAGGPPEWLRSALAEVREHDAATSYPDENVATAATAARHGRREDEVVLTNGASEALWLLGPALRPALAAI